ncbi:MAG: NUDIX domain-containing protein [Nocardioides sp.]|uniref:NUDIX domain-containing protein n=1 Tax=Nocardioides sp. TaxID=35761 RepID=UPI0039E41B2F
MEGRFVVVPAAYVFLLREGERGTEVLLQLRQHTGYMDEHWAAAAAGHVEKGETAHDAAHREADEEIGLTGVALDFLTSMQRTQRGAAIDERIDFFFTARSWSGTPVIREPAKCADLRWFPLAALPDPVVPHELFALGFVVAGTAPPYTTFGFTER